MTEPAPARDDGERQADVRRKFREALERKQALARAGASHEDVGSRATHAHGPAARKRDFRRKSG